METRGNAKLGLIILTALVTGNMIGSGVFLLPSSLAAFGSVGILAWIFTAIGAILLALVFAELSKLVPKVGGPYAYCYAGFGEYVGFQIAYNYWVAIWVGNAAIVVAFVGYLTYFWPGLAANTHLQFIIAVATVWLVTFVNIFGIHHAGLLQLLTTILKIIPLLLVGIVGLIFLRGHVLTEAFNVSGKPFFSALSGAAVLTLWSFIGLESATVPAENVINPTRNIPRATIIGTLLAASLYIISTAVIMSVIPINVLKTSDAPYAAAAKFLFGGWGGWLVGAGAIISCFGALNGWILLAGQIPYAAAKDGLFPKFFARKNKKGTPFLGLILSSSLVTLLLLLTLNKNVVNKFTLIILLATLSSLVPYFFTTMAELMLLIKRHAEFSKKRLVASLIIAILAGLYAFWTIGSVGTEILYYGTLFMFTGVPLYVWLKWQHSEEVDKKS